MAGVGLTLDDLRQPDFGGRIWGYDRDEVDQLLASVVTSIERLQRRRQRDAAAIEKAAVETAAATERAEQAERERDELAIRLERALEGTSKKGDGDVHGPSAVGPAAVVVREAERLVAEAEERAGRAEQQVLVLREEVAAQQARTRRVEDAEAEARELRTELDLAAERAERSEWAEPDHATDLVPVPMAPLTEPVELSEEVYARLPLAQRASRALLREARARAQAIVAEAEERTRVS